MNYKIELFKQKMIELINQSELPVGTIYYIIKDLFKQLENTYFQQVEKQFKQLKQNEEKQDQNQQKEMTE